MVFEQISKIIAEKLDIDPSLIREDSSFMEMQIDSLYMVEIMLMIEETFDIIVEDASGLETVRDLCTCVENKLK